MEPLSHLDIVLRQDLLTFFQELFQELPMAVVYVTHDPWEARKLSSQTIIFESGGIVYEGAVKDLPPDSPSTFIQGVHKIF